MADNQIDGDLRVIGHIGAATMTLPANCVSNSHIKSDAAIARSKLAQDNLATYPVQLTDFRVHDDLAANLPATSSNDDLGLHTDDPATGSPSLRSYDVKGAGAVTLYARTQINLPPEYVDGETVTIRLHTGMLTTISDGTATVDVECYESDEEGGVGADLCSTVAQSCNSLTLEDKDFAITSTGLAAGDILDVRIAMAINDGTTGATVQGIIGAVKLLCDIKG